MDRSDFLLFKQRKFPLKLYHIMSHVVYRTIGPLYLKIPVVRGKPLVENVDDLYYLFTNNELSWSFFSLVSGITLYADLHSTFVLSTPPLNLRQSCDTTCDRLTT